MLNTFAIIFHLIAINIWVGGMFFIIVVLGRVMSSLEIAEQNDLWQKILPRFFFWVWLAAIVLLISGGGMIFYRFGGFSHIPGYILMMAGFGVLMVLVFSIIYFVFYQRFKYEMQNGNMDASRYQLRIIRLLGIVNMALGFCVVIIIGSGPYF